MVTSNNHKFRPLTGHHQVVHLMKTAEGCTIYIYIYIYSCILTLKPLLFNFVIRAGNFFL